MSIQALREQRAAKAKALNELATKAEWNATVDQPIYDQGLAELDAIDARISNIQRANERMVEDAIDANAIIAAERIARDTGSKTMSLYAKYLRLGVENMAPEDRQAILNTMSVGTGNQGGYTVQTEVVASLLDAMKAFGAMRSVATVLSTAQGNPMSFPTSDGTTETGEWVAENAAAAAADPTFGTIGLPVYKASSKVVAIPYELLQDSSIDVEAFVRNRLATRLGRITNTGYTVGTGSGQPTGLITAAATGYTCPNSTSQVTAVTYDSLVELQHSIDPAYRALGNCGWMFNDSTLKKIRQMKDGQSRPIFVPGYEAGVPGGVPDTLLGSAITINQDMAAMAANAKSIAFGDFSFYNIRDVMDVTMFRFTDSAYAKLGQVGFLAWMRTGGNLIDVGGAVKLLANAAS
ncbi:phage major capsid protein [Novosphingobium olei]|uniref:phage major capsid protein n=1 Tax=Novosphingobium olei TaxID=2728851 RepID=UPI0030875311|nr:phage major capsid protein [Novosphingobium olei]